MTRFPVTLTVGAVIVALSGSVAGAALPPTVVWSDNFAGANGTGISTLPGWAAIPTFNTLTSYAIENTFSPPVSARTFGMNNNAVYTLQTTVSGMSAKTSQWFHFKAHQANGVSTTLLDEVRVTTSGGFIFYFRIAERQSMALFESPADNSGNLGDKLSDNAWHEFDIKYNNSAGSQTITYLINNATAWTKSATSPGYITSVQFVQQGGAKPATGENHLIGEMAVGTSDVNCTPPAAPTGINASSSTVCTGAPTTLSVNNPGAGLTTDWFTGGCGTTPVQNGTGVNSVQVSPTSTTTYYARTRNTAITGCVSATCQSVTVTVPNCDDNNSCTNDTCSNGVCGHTNAANGAACADDGNPCTNDTCNNGTCTHPNAANGTACNDTNPCTDPDTCQNGTCVGGPPVVCNVTNGFDPDRIYVIRGGAWDSEVRMLNENAADVLHNDLGPFGTQADKTWPTAVATLHDPDGPGGDDGQDASVVKSICFSNSPSAGHNSPAGVRFFGVYDVRALDEPNTPDMDETTYSSAGFQIVELNSAGKRIRVMKVGLAANTNPGNTSTDALTDLCWHGCSPGADPVDYRNNTNGCRVGTIRYNRAKNTLCVSANIGEHDDGDPCRPPVGRVYEFELPDWPEVYYTSGLDIGQPIPQSDPNVVKLVQIYEMPSRCDTNQGTRYDLNRCDCMAQGGTWHGHSVLQEHCTGFKTGRNEGQRSVITFDDDGNMYFTSTFFCATDSNPPGSAGCGTWSGAGLPWGDVLKCSTIGHWAGKNTYIIPITGTDPISGQDNAKKLVIQATIEDALASGYPPHTEYGSGPGLAVRGNRLFQMPAIECNDLSAGTYRFVNVFDLNNTIGGPYPNELVRIKSLTAVAFSGANWTNSTKTLTKTGAFADYIFDSDTITLTAGTGVTLGQYVVASKVSSDAITLTTDINGASGDILDQSVAGMINTGGRCNIARKPNYAQSEVTSGKTFMGDIMGACDCAQNFMYVNASPVDTVIPNVGYFLTVTNPNGSAPGNLDHTWDAASPAAAVVDQIGACCLSAESCQSMSQTACAAANGFWQGKGTTCGQFSCLTAGGACYRPCTPCQQTLQADCESLQGNVWAGLGSVCGVDAPRVCPTITLDGDCDGDVDMDDFGLFQLCYNPGGSIPGTPSNCVCFDVAGGNPNGPDGVIDHFDFDAFMGCASHRGVPAAPCP